MKKVEAIILPHKLEDVRDSLLAHGVEGLSASEVRGSGHEPEQISYYRGTPCDIDLHPKVKLEIVVCDEDAMQTAYAIVDAARTGRVGDGKVTIVAVEDVIRIRTSEHGPAAIRNNVEPVVEKRWAAQG